MNARAPSVSRAVNAVIAADPEEPIALLQETAWVPIARGILSILLSAAAFAVPGTSLHVLTALVGVYALAVGILAVYAAMVLASSHHAWLAMALDGSVGVSAGVVAFRAPGLTAMTLFCLFAVWALLRGVLELATARELRHLVPGERATAAGGALSVLLGCLLFACPGAGRLAWLWIVGFYAIPYGMLMLSLGFRLRSLATAAR